MLNGIEDDSLSRAPAPLLRPCVCTYDTIPWAMERKGLRKECLILAMMSAILSAVFSPFQDFSLDLHSVEISLEFPFFLNDFHTELQFLCIA